MKLFLRYDDFSALSDTSIEEKLLVAMDGSGLKCTFAVTPWFADVGAVMPGNDLPLRPLSRSKCRMLEKGMAAGLVEVALHGYSHLCTSRLRSMAEFSAAIPVDRQRSLIRAGKDYLEDWFGVPISTFVPPWNLCADQTLRALREEGVSVVSAARPLTFASTCEVDSVRRESLSYIPAMVGIGDARVLTALAKRFDAADALLSFVIHDYDFAESPYRTSLKPVDESIAEFSSYVRNAGCESVLAREISEDIGRDYERYSANLAFGRSIWKTALRRHFASEMANVYWSTHSARKLNRMVGWIP